MKPLLLSLSIFGTFLFADAPVGFEDPKLLAKVMAGEIVTVRIIETKIESKATVKAFFRKVDVEKYVDLIVDYDGYPKLFSQVVEGKLVSANTEKNQFDYWLHARVKVGPFMKDTYPEGRHTIAWGKTPEAETVVSNELINGKQIEFGRQRTRLIPYQDGFLVEDSVHVKAIDSSVVSTTTKKYGMEFFLSFTQTLRDALKAD